MKKKLVRILLVLVMCMGLAVPAYAEPVEEPPISQEQEIETPLEVSYASICVRGYPDLTWEEVETEQIGENTVRTVYRVRRASGQEPVSVDAFSVSTQNSPGYCTECGKKNWGPANHIDTDYVEITSSTHTEIKIIAYLCLTADCFRKNVQWLDTEVSVYYHSYTKKGDLVKRQSVDASTHESKYSYSCRCGATTTKTETEDHDLEKRFTGKHYHPDGSPNHMAEYTYYCSTCGYRKTQWEPYPCPGGNGGSCLYPNRLPDEPVVTEALDESEGVDVPEETVMPEDFIGPGETAAPDDGERGE